MKSIVIDTCILIYLTQNNERSIKCLQALRDFDSNPEIIISIATLGEINSFQLQNRWSEGRVIKLNHFLSDVTIIDISKEYNELIQAYYEIDAYSKKKFQDRNGDYLSGSHKNMGKNDLWIAATAYILDATLLTADGDFDHLNGSFLDVKKVV